MFRERLPAWQPGATILQNGCIQPEADIRVTGGYQFRKQNFSLLLTIGHPKMPPAKGAITGCPF
jgi:hypothetical protein